MMTIGHRSLRRRPVEIPHRVVRGVQQRDHRVRLLFAPPRDVILRQRAPLVARPQRRGGALRRREFDRDPQRRRQIPNLPRAPRGNQRGVALALRERPRRDRALALRAQNLQIVRGEEEHAVVQRVVHLRAVLRAMRQMLPPPFKKRLHRRRVSSAKHVPLRALTDAALRRRVARVRHDVDDVRA
eukprot:31492-Pelagococcus_subviridis.AAC.4